MFSTYDSWKLATPEEDAGWWDDEEEDWEEEEWLELDEFDWQCKWSEEDDGSYHWGRPKLERKDASV